MNKCLAAFTAFTESPPFINASLTPEDTVEVMLRSEPRPQEGKNFPVADMASMKMSRADFIKWATEALEELQK